MKIEHFRKRIVSLLPILLVFVLSGCAFSVKFVGKYDELLDNSIHQMQTETMVHIEKVIEFKGKGEGSYEKSKAFYREKIAEIEALLVRVDIIEEGLKNKPLTNNFTSLREQYEDLITSHSSYNELVVGSAKEAMKRSFRAISKQLMFMKWNSKPNKE